MLIAYLQHAQKEAEEVRMGMREGRGKGREGEISPLCVCQANPWVRPPI